MDAILSLGGTRATVVPLARLVGAALAAGYELLPLSASEVSIDESALLQQLAHAQHGVKLSATDRRGNLVGSLLDAAAAFDRLTLRLLPPALGIVESDDRNLDI